MCAILTYISVGYSLESSHRPEPTNFHIMDLRLLFWAVRLLREDNSGMLGMGSQLSGVDKATAVSRKLTELQRHFSSKQKSFLEGVCGGRSGRLWAIGDASVYEEPATKMHRSIKDTSI